MLKQQTLKSWMWFLGIYCLSIVILGTLSLLVRYFWRTIIR